MDSYDEDINENGWYETLRDKFEDLFFRVTNERWMVRLLHILLHVYISYININ